MGGASTATAARPRDADTKLARSRLGVLELAKELGNVAEACRQRGLDRSSFYEWKRRIQTQGFEGLKDLPPIHKSHPQTTPPDLAQRMPRRDARLQIDIAEQRPARRVRPAHLNPRQRPQRVNHVLRIQSRTELFSSLPVSIIVPWEFSSIASGLVDRKSDLPERFPEPFLNLLNAIIDPEQARPPSDLASVLERCRAAKPDLENTTRYRRLSAIARRLGA